MSGGVGEGGRRKFLIFFFFFTFHYPFTCLYFCSLKICRNNTNEYSNIIWSIKNKLHKLKKNWTLSLYSVSFILHFSFFVFHPSIYTFRPLSFILQPALYILYSLSLNLHSSFIIFYYHPSSFNLHLSSFSSLDHPFLFFFSPIFILYPSLLTLFFSTPPS